MGGIEVFTADRVADVITAARAVQIPLLAVLLLGACAAKARRAVATRSIAAGTGPTAMFPVRLHKPMAIALFTAEFALGIGLLLTSGRIGAGAPALVIRIATALLFAMGIGALHVLRGRQPDAGCGCFGDLSDTPVSWQSLTRSALLCGAAAATFGVPPLHLPANAIQAAVVLSVAAAELLLLAFLSPEIGELMVRLGYSEPCEVRRLPVSRTLAALRASSHWRRYRRILTSPEDEPVDVWREGCWRYVVYQGQVASRRVDVVFAVYLKARRAPVRAGIFDATADKRAREAADAAAALERSIPAPRQAPVSSHPTPVAASARAHSVPHRGPHRTVHHVPHQRPGILRISKRL